MMNGELDNATSEQARFVLLSELAGRPGALTVPLAFELVGAVDVDRLTAAVAGVVARHETLRTVFERHRTALRRRVLPEGPQLRLLDMSTSAEADDTKVSGLVDALLVDNDNRALDIAQGPVFDACLVRLTGERSLLLMSAHHVAVDAWSLYLVVRDLGALYAGLTLPASRQYRQLARRETAWRSSEEARDELTRTCASLQGLPPAITLPGGAQRPFTRSYEVGTTTIPVSASDFAELELRSRSAGGTPLVGLLALLARWWADETDCPEFVVGVPVNSRWEVGDDTVVGPLLNTVLLRLPSRRDRTFSEGVADVRERLFEALDRARVPFDTVVAALRLPRTASYPPLCQVMALSQNATDVDLHLPGLAVRRLPRNAQRTSELDLMFGIDVGNRTAFLEFATDLYTPTQAARLAARLATTWAAAAGAARPTHLVSRATASHMAEPGPRPGQARDNRASRRGLMECLRARAERDPEGAAVVHDGVVTSIGELYESALRLAAKLVTLGVGVDDIVAVRMHPGPDLVAALIGVLESGGAYLPIDPDLPAERTEWMLRDARPVALVENLRDDGATPLLRRPPRGDYQERPLPESRAAYVLYTSGSTGMPKGVVVDHSAVGAYLAWACDAYPGLAGIALLPTPVTFDLTLTGLFGPLVAGGCVRIAQIDDELPVGEASPTFLKVTPSHLPLLTESILPTSDLVVGGEALTGAHVARVSAILPPTTVVINEYGPTEATVGCVLHRLSPDASLLDSPVPIGKPAPGVAVYVLDDQGRPVAEGMVGELYVSSAQLARGYLGRPELTAARFVPCPDGPPGTRMYRTGDLVRASSDGVLWFRGRSDDQVKIRGHRLELGEVEAALSRIEGVSAASADLRDGLLIGYVVSAPSLSTDSMRSHLARWLPDHAIPTTVVQLEAMPLTAHGKVDRAQLPDPVGRRTDAADWRPRTATERLVARVWSEVLGAQVDGRDRILDVGGDSLRAGMIAARIRKLFAIPVGLRDVFAHDTVQTFARWLDSCSPAATERPPGDEPG